MQPGEPLDDLLLELTGASRPRVLLLPTASAESEAYVVRFYEAFARRAEASHLSLFGIPPADIRSVVLDQDAIFVGGGNTANMLAIWRVHGVDRFAARGVGGRRRPRRGERGLDLLVRGRRHRLVPGGARRARLPGVPARLELPALRRRGDAAPRASTGSSPRASRRDSPPTTSSGSASAGPSSRRSSPRGPMRRPTGWSSWTAMLWRSGSNREGSDEALAFSVRHRTRPVSGTARPRSGLPRIGPVGFRAVPGALLELRNVEARYGPVAALHGVSLTVGEGEIVAVLGANGAGKTTTLRAVSGTVRRSGEILLDGAPIGRTPEATARQQVAHVPEGRGTFVELSVEREPPPRRVHAARRRRRRRPRPRPRLVPVSPRAAPAAGGHALRRRAADARPRPRADALAAAAAPRRALARARTDRRRRAVRASSGG